MSKTVYLKIRQLTKTDKQDVYLSDVAEVYAEKKLLPKIKSIKLATFYRTKKDRVCISSMQVISAIQQLDDLHSLALPNGQLVHQRIRVYI